MSPWLLAVAPLSTLGLTVLNLLTWPRAVDEEASMPAVSALIPARNEEHTIGASVRALLAEPVAEVVVCDDGSTDGTAAVLAAIDDPRLRVVQGEPLPSGWVGKVHACARLAREAQHDELLFVDADTVLLPGGLQRLWALRRRYRADLVSALPHQQLGTVAERLLMPLLHVTYTSWFPLALVHLSQWPSLLAANGQVLSMSREGLRAAGGFEAIRHEVVDDMALCRQVKRAGRRVVFADGARVARCRMYSGGRELWEGFAKNVYEGLGSVPAMAAALAAYGLAFLVPWLALWIAPWWPEVLLPAAIGVVANLAQRALLARRFDQTPLSVLAHPVAVIALMTLALDSFRRARSGRIAWKGRVYAERGARVS